MTKPWHTRFILKLAQALMALSMLIAPHAKAITVNCYLGTSLLCSTCSPGCINLGVFRCIPNGGTQLTTNLGGDILFVTGGQLIYNAGPSNVPCCSCCPDSCFQDAVIVNTNNFVDFIADPNAISANGTAIHVVSGANPAGNISLDTLSSIFGSTAGIWADTGTISNILNQGQIRGGIGIEITTANTNGVINNGESSSLSAVIQGTGGAGILLSTTTSRLNSILNSGLIEGTSAGIDTSNVTTGGITTGILNLGPPFIGTITSTNGSALNIAGTIGAVTSTCTSPSAWLCNAGTISINNANPTVNILSGAVLTGGITNSATLANTGAGSAIVLNATMQDVINSGTISAVAGSAILLNATMQDIINSGTISNTSTTAPTIQLVAGKTLTNGILNTNTIHNTSSANAIDIQGPVGPVSSTCTSPAAFICNSGGTIASTSTAGNATIFIESTATTLGGAGITNSNVGAITNSGPGNAINVAGPIGNIINSSTISNASGAAVVNYPTIVTASTANIPNGINNSGTIKNTGNGSAMDLNGAIGAIGVAGLTNSGFIQNISSTSNFATIITESSVLMPGGISNTGTGTIQNTNATSASALDLSGTLGSISVAGLTNAGTISNTSTTSPTIMTENGANIAGGIINTNTIINNTPLQTAVDLRLGLITTRLFQNAGSITGNVFLSNGGGKVFDLNGGTITGNVTASAVPANNIINLNGGSIVTTPLTSGVLFLNGTAGDTVNLTKTSDVREIQGGTPFKDKLLINSGSTSTSITIAGPPLSPSVNRIFDVNTITVYTPLIMNGIIGGGANNSFFQTFLAITGGPVIQSGSITGAFPAHNYTTFTTLDSYFLCSATDLAPCIARGTLSGVYSITFDGLTTIDGDISAFQSLLATAPVTQSGSVTGTGFAPGDSTFETDSSYTLNPYGGVGPPLNGVLTDVYSISFKGTTLIKGYISNFHTLLASNTASLTQTGTIIGTGFGVGGSLFETDGSYTLGPFAAGAPPTGYLSQINTITFKGNTVINGKIDNFTDIEAFGPVTQSGLIQGILGTSFLNSYANYTLCGGAGNPNGTCIASGTIDSVSPIVFNGTATLAGTISNVDSLTTEQTVTQTGSITGLNTLSSTMTTNGPYTVIAPGAISTFLTLTTNDTFTQGGTVSNIDTVLVNSIFNQNKIMTNINTIEVANGGAFTANGPNTSVNIDFQVDSGGNALVNAPVTGGVSASVVNNGNMTISDTGFVNFVGAFGNGYSGHGNLTLGSTPISGDNMTVKQYHQQTGATLTIDFTSDTNWGSVQVTGGPIVFDPGTFIGTTFFSEPTYLTDGTLFPIVYGGPVTDNGVVILPTNSPIISFTKLITGGDTIFNLVFHRNSYTHCASSPIAISIAEILDLIVLANGFGIPGFQDLILQIDLLNSCGQINDVLEALSPDVSYGMIEGAHIGMDRTFGLLWQRLEDFHKYRNAAVGNSQFYGGYNSGDAAAEGPYGIWVAPYGEWLRQDGRDYNHGYRATALGGAIGFDRTLLNDSIWGMAASFTRVHVVGSTFERNVENVSSLQGTLYTFWEPLESLSADLMLGMALNKFHNNRFINVGTVNLVPTSTFYGWQYGGQFDLGYVDCEESLYIVPMMRIKGTYLSLDSFTEKNAGPIGLTTKNRSLTQLLAGGGFRFAKQVVGYPFSSVPEISCLYLYDFSDQAQQTVANFIGGGVAFPTVGTRPPRNVFLIDLAYELFEVEQKDRVVTARYELELREKFIANSGYIEFYYQWC